MQCEATARTVQIVFSSSKSGCLPQTPCDSKHFKLYHLLWGSATYRYMWKIMHYLFSFIGNRSCLITIILPGRHNTQIWALHIESLYSLPFALQCWMWYQIVGQIVTRWCRPVNGSPATKLLPSFVEQNHRTKMRKVKKRSLSTLELIRHACWGMNQGWRMDFMGCLQTHKGTSASSTQANISWPAVLSPWAVSWLRMTCWTTLFKHRRLTQRHRNTGNGLYTCTSPSQSFPGARCFGTLSTSC